MSRTVLALRRPAHHTSQPSIFFLKAASEEAARAGCGGHIRLLAPLERMKRHFLQLIIVPEILTATSCVTATGLVGSSNDGVANILHLLELVLVLISLCRRGSAMFSRQQVIIMNQQAEAWQVSDS